jgi:hypothetical protein
MITYSWHPRRPKQYSSGTYQRRYIDGLALANSRISRLFEDDERQSDILRRSFWSILIIERFDVLDRFRIVINTDTELPVTFHITSICLKATYGNLTIVFSSQEYRPLGSHVARTSGNYYTACDLPIALECPRTLLRPTFWPKLPCAA